MKILLGVLLVLGFPVLVHAQCISSGGGLGCAVPGATVTGTGTSQVVAFSGATTAGSTSTVAGLLTVTNCATSSCSTASAGATIIAAGATTATITTSAVTANSQIFIGEDTSLSARLGVTCNTQALTLLGAPRPTTRTAATSFVVSIDIAPTATPMCFNWWIVN